MILYPACTSFLSSSEVKSVVFLLTADATPISSLARENWAKNKANMKVLGIKQNKDVEELHKLYKSGRLKLVIDGPYPLSEAGKAIKYFGDGLHRGKIILKVD